MWGIEGADGMEGGLNVRGDGMKQEEVEWEMDGIEWR